MKRIKLREGDVENILDLGDFILEFSGDWSLVGIEFNGKYA